MNYIFLILVFPAIVFGSDRLPTEIRFYHDRAPLFGFELNDIELFIKEVERKGKPTFYPNNALQFVDYEIKKAKELAQLTGWELSTSRSSDLSPLEIRFRHGLAPSFGFQMKDIDSYIEEVKLKGIPEVYPNHAPQFVDYEIKKAKELINLKEIDGILKYKALNPCSVFL